MITEGRDSTASMALIFIAHEPEEVQ